MLPWHILHKGRKFRTPHFDAYGQEIMGAIKKTFIGD